MQIEQGKLPSQLKVAQKKSKIVVRLEMEWRLSFALLLNILSEALVHKPL